MKREKDTHKARSEEESGGPAGNAGWAAHLTAQEKAEVLALWEKEERGRMSRESEPTIQDLAEGLEIPPERVGDLLEKARARRAAARERLRRGSRYALVPLVAAALGVFYFKVI